MITPLLATGIFLATDFGAIPDDGLDDHAALTAAVEAAHDAGGGTVQLPPGELHLDAGHLRLLSGVTITGDGASIRSRGQHSALWARFASDIAVVGFRLEGDLMPPSGALVSLSNVDGMLLDSMELINANHDSIHALVGCTDLTWTNNTIDGAGDDGLNPGGGGEGIGTNGVLISGNVVRNVTNDGIHVSVMSFGVTVTGNTVIDCGRGIAFIGSHDSHIEGNTITDCDHGIETVGVAAYGPTPGMTIVGNTLTNSGVIAIEGACCAVVDNVADVIDVSGYSLEYGNTSSSGNTPGDVTCDERIDVADLLAVLAVWGPCTPLNRADVDGSGTVDVTDLLALLANWGTT